MQKEENDEINDRQTTLNSLDGFNQQICQTSDTLLGQISIFHSFLPKLIPISQTMSEVFEGEPKSEDKSSYINPTKQYIEVSCSLSELIYNYVIRIVGDNFTTNQISQTRELFAWFLDIAKSFNEFHPKPVYLPPNVVAVKLSEKFQEKLEKQYSEIVLQLANNLQQQPNDLHSLNILPASFPHHVVAFSQLLCRIIDVQQHLMLSESSYKSENERNSVILKYPSSKMLLKNSKFRASIDLQNELLNMVRIEKRNLKRLFEKAKRAKTEFRETRERLTQTIQTGFIDLREANISLLEELVQIETHIRTYKTAKVLRDRYKKFTIDAQFDKEALIEDQKLTCGYHSEYLGEIIKKQVLTLKNIKDRLMSTTSACRQYLDGQNAKIKDLSNSMNFLIKEYDKRRCDLYQFRQIIDSIRKSGTASMAAFSKFLTVEDGTDLVPLLLERNASKNAILLKSAYLPSIENMDNIINSLYSLIGNKNEAFRESNRKTIETRKSIDKMNATFETVKRKIDHPDESCLRCQTERDYVILSCGHTFCSDCYTRYKLEQAKKCPFCKKGYSRDDLNRIEWEF